MFHKNISNENKERLTKIKEAIEKTLQTEGYTKGNVISKRLLDLSFTPINLIELGFLKENIQYKITIEIMGSRSKQLDKIMILIMPEINKRR